MGVRFGLPRKVVAALILGLCAIGTTAAATPEAPGQDARQVVLDFYQAALIDKQPRAAFARYMSADFIEHKPDVAGGTRDAAAAFLEELMTELPAARWEIVRSVADAHFVVIHARFTPAPDAAPYAIADFFRVKEGRIVEHWDVVAGPAESKGNPHSRF